MDGQSSNQHRGAGDAPSQITPRTSLSYTDSDVSPLQIFVQAKRNINDIFQDIEVYIKEAAEYVQGK